MKEIENILGLSEGKIKKRMKEIEDNVPTFPGTRYLKALRKKFDVQPWPFLNYLAYYAPKEFKELLSCYSDYDGNENSELVIEGLKESYLTFLVLEKREKEAKEKGIPI